MIPSTVLAPLPATYRRLLSRPDVLRRFVVRLSDQPLVFWFPRPLNLPEHLPERLPLKRLKLPDVNQVWFPLAMDRLPLVFRFPRLQLPRLQFPWLQFPWLRFPRLRFPRLRFLRLQFPWLQFPRFRFPPEVDHLVLGLMERQILGGC